jgi:hypothetical protein
LKYVDPNGGALGGIGRCQQSLLVGR